ncbi:hypothetical protein [Streptomyces aureoversilis]|uniref:Uncharacterized protein n=1 Tax=Streptomyces aureoversilis TaxID=67277 RepID=A0ABW0A9I6_9ACTN
MAKQFPAMLAVIARIAWARRPRALTVLVGAQLASGLMTAFFAGLAHPSSKMIAKDVTPQGSSTPLWVIPPT